MTLRAPLIAKGVDRFVGNFWTCPCYMTLRKCLPPNCGDPGPLRAPLAPPLPLPQRAMVASPRSEKALSRPVMGPKQSCDPFFCYFVILEEITWMAWLHPNQQILHNPPFSDLGGSSHLLTGFGASPLSTPPAPPLGVCVLGSKVGKPCLDPPESWGNNPAWLDARPQWRTYPAPPFPRWPTPGQPTPAPHPDPPPPGRPTPSKRPHPPAPRTRK